MCKEATSQNHCGNLKRTLSNRRLAGYKFRRQLPVGPYIADFVCLSARLVVELDGGQHAANVARNEIRTRFLESQGYEVVRFWNNDVLLNLQGALTVLLQALQRRERLFD